MSTQRIFISYRRDDCGPQATSIYYGLLRELDASVFLDVDSIGGGLDFVEEIRREIERSDVILVVIGDDWLDIRDEGGSPRIQNAEDYVFQEIKLGLARQAPVIPVLVEGARMPTEAELPAELSPLARRNAVTVRDESLPQDIRQLAAQIQAIGQRSEADGPASEPEPPASLTPRVLLEDDDVAGATLAAAERLQLRERELVSEGKHVLERDLSKAIAEELAGGRLEQQWPVPNWDPQPGRFDVLVEGPDGRPRLAIETKLKDNNALYECLWDLLKLTSLATLDHVEGTYIVAGTTSRNWAKPIETAELFESGEHAPVELIRAIGDWWKRYILGDSAGRPRWAPPDVEAELVAAVALTLRGEPWELRTIRVTPTTHEWVPFVDGQPPAEKDAVEAPPEPGELDTVIVAARTAYADYLALSAYICQPGRSIRDLSRLGFYRERAIQCEIPLVLERRDAQPFTREHAQALRANGDAMDARVAAIIEGSLEGRGIGKREAGDRYQVFVLTGPDDPQTIGISPVLHHGSGAWTQSQRYTTLESLKSAKSTEELELETKTKRKLDLDRAKLFIESVPTGRWTTYGDVAAAAGGPRGAQAIGEWLSRVGAAEIPAVYRVLRSNGEISEGFSSTSGDCPRTPEEVRTRLESEGVILDESGRAHPGQRWRARDWPG